jgi:hypothetical protein
LAESKNASVVRKHFGYSHIPKQYAAPINALYEKPFNPWLNLQRPCMFASEITSPKGKIVKRYKHADVKTPLERLSELAAQGSVTFKASISLNSLTQTAKEKTDLKTAEEMQKAKVALFAKFNRPSAALKQA